jgi:hypothetical protein
MLTEAAAKFLFSPPNTKHRSKDGRDDVRGSKNLRFFPSDLFRKFLKKSSEKVLTEG